MSLEKIKRVHCIGIGGIGVSAIAKFFVNKDAYVSGSDVNHFDEMEDLNKRGVEIYAGSKLEKITKDIDLIVYTSAIIQEDAELLKAKELGITCLSYVETLALIQENYKQNISVSGTNGKTTVTAMLGKILEKGELDPIVFVGGQVKGWDKNFRMGNLDIMLVEGCEYKRNMLNLKPNIITLTNIEEDHLDYYKDLDDIKGAFTEYVSKLSENDLLVYNADDKNIKDVIDNAIAKKISYGIKNDADIVAENVSYEKGRQFFDLIYKGDNLGQIKIAIPGIFNIYNSLSAITTALEIGVSFEKIRQTLEVFAGTWRRFELAGYLNDTDTTIITDYAHHPIAIKETISATKQFYGNSRVLVVFQPHHRDRTVKLFDDFVEAFVGVDEVIITEIFDVAGREDKNLKISSKDLVREIQNRGGVDLVTYAKDLDDTYDLIKKKLPDYDMVLMMGAGDIDSVARRLVSEQ